MNKEYVLRIDIINMILRFLITFTLSSLFILLVTGEDTYIWMALILLPVSIMSFVINSYAENIWINLGLHLVLLVGCIYMTDHIVLKIAFGAFVIIFAVLQFAVTNISLPFVSVFLLIYLIISYAYPGLTLLKQFFFYLATLFGLNYLLKMYYVNFYIYFQNHKEKTNIPIKQIKSSHRLLITGFLGFCLIVIMVFSKFPLGYIFGSIGKYLMQLIGLLSNRSVSDQIKTEDVVQEGTNLQQGVPSTGLPEAEPSKFMEITDHIASVVFIGIFIAIIIIFLGKEFYKFYQFYYKKKVRDIGADKIEVALPLEKSRIKFFGQQGTSRKGIFNLFGLSDNDRIRMHYRKAVQKNARLEKELKYKTPSQLSEYALSSKEKSAALTALYEKARYSHEECSREEVQSVKNLLK